MSELWDLVDEQGAPLGRTHRRDDADFPEGLFHVVASVCVIRPDGRVLTSRRASVKDWPLAWEFPAGSALAGESSPEAAVRELAEETGIHVDRDRLLHIGRVTEERALFDLYAVRVEETPDLSLDPDEVSEAEWVDLGVVFERAAQGAMAGPWVRRLSQLHDPLTALVRA